MLKETDAKLCLRRLFPHLLLLAQNQLSMVGEGQARRTAFTYRLLRTYGCHILEVHPDISLRRVSIGTFHACEDDDCCKVL